MPRYNGSVITTKPNANMHFVRSPCFAFCSIITITDVAYFLRYVYYIRFQGHIVNGVVSLSPQKSMNMSCWYYWW